MGARRKKGLWQYAGVGLYSLYRWPILNSVHLAFQKILSRWRVKTVIYPYEEKGMERGVAEVKGRINGLVFVVIGAIIAQVILGLVQ